MKAGTGGRRVDWASLVLLLVAAEAVVRWLGAEAGWRGSRP